MAQTPIMLRVRHAAMSAYVDQLRNDVYRGGNDSVRADMDVAEYLLNEVSREIAAWHRENESAIETLRRERLIN